MAKGKHCPFFYFFFGGIGSTRVLPARASVRSGRFWRMAGRRALERPSDQVVAL